MSKRKISLKIHIFPHHFEKFEDDPLGSNHISIDLPQLFGATLSLFEKVNFINIYHEESFSP